LAAVRSGLTRIVSAAQATTPDITIDVDVDERSLRDAEESTGRLTRAASAALGPLGELGGALGRTGAAAGALPQALIGVVTSIEQILPAAAVATTGLLAIRSASGAVQVAMIGVSDAIDLAFDPDADPEELAKAIAKLAPEARAFVTELQSMQKELWGLQQGVQNRFFQDFDDSLSELSTAVLPAVQKSLNASAVSLNRMAVGASDAAVTLGTSGILGTALKSANAGLADLERIPGQAVIAFGQLAAAAGPSFERITTALARVADGAAAALSRAFASGALEDAIDAAIDTIVQLGRIAGNVFEALGNIMNAVSGDGEGLFSVLEIITGALAEATGTDGFQRALAALSRTMSTVASTAAPLLVQALALLGPIFEILAPPAQELVRVLGAGLQDILTALGPVLASAAGAVGDLVVALLPLVTLAAELVAGALPALTPLFESLSETFVLLTPLIEQLARNLAAQLMPLLTALPEILRQILPAFGQFGEQILPVLLDALVQLEPSLLQLSQALADLLVALTPIIVAWIQLAAATWAQAMPAITAVSKVIITLVTGALQLLSGFLTRYVIPTIHIVTALLDGDFTGAMRNAGAVVTNMSEDGTRAFESLKSRSTKLVAQMVVEIPAAGRRMATAFVNAIVQMAADAVGRVQALPGRIRAALPGAEGILRAAGQAIIRGLIAGITSMLPSLSGTLQSITSRLPDWKGPEDLDRRILIPAGRAVMEGFMKGITDSVPALEQQLASLTTSLPGLAPQVEMSSSRSITARQIFEPVIQVSIGNRAIDDYVDARLDVWDRQRNKSQAQGWRR
ncbi:MULTISPECIES: hypothetical protein, partial [unclassified Streptomyces]|uniref:phage tail protein n=1 Tax=unclassified Streptomyces TaxID=2593676 RepID=UPI00081D7C63